MRLTGNHPLESRGKHFKNIREIYTPFYERKITNFIMLLNIVRSSVLKRHSYLYMARESEQRFDVSEKITVFLFYFWNEPVEAIPYAFWAGE